MLLSSIKIFLYGKTKKKYVKIWAHTHAVSCQQAYKYVHYMYGNTSTSTAKSKIYYTRQTQVMNTDNLRHFPQMRVMQNIINASIIKFTSVLVLKKNIL